MAWGARQNAAAQHLGAPSGHEQRYLNKASGKMETRHQMKAYNVAGRTPRKGEGQGGAHKPPARPPAGGGGHPAAHPSGGGESLPLAQLSPAQLAHRATKIGQGEQAAALNPLKAQAAEINANQGAVQAQYKGYGDSQNTLLQQLQEKQEGSAKTAENQAAANALQAGKAIETTGQSQASQTAGYISPELKAEMNAQGQRAVGMGGAGNALASNLGTNETNYLTNLRASAAQKILQGQQGIASTYGKQLGGVRAKESEVTGKLAPNIANKRGEMERTQFNQRATLQGLGLKQNTLEQKGKEATAKNRTTARGQNLTRESAQERAGLTKRGQDISQAHYERSDKTARDRARKAASASGVKNPVGNKMAEEIGAGFNAIQDLRTKGVPEGKISAILNTGSRRVESKDGKEVKQTYSKVKNPALQKAAFELWKTHKVSPATLQALHSVGFTLTSDQLAALVGLPPRTPSTGVTGGVNAAR